MEQCQYLQVADDEGEDAIELPSEEDGTLLLTTLAAQFPGACGLKYKNAQSGNWRGVRLTDGKLHPPDGTWATGTTYINVYPKGHASNTENKRKGEQVFDSHTSAAKMKRQAADAGKTSDLVILGLAYTADESDLREYFDQFGQVLMTQIKRDPGTGKSKGFGFVRFAEYDVQIKVLSQRHMICGRWCEVKLPNSNNNKGDTDMLSRKIFVGRCTEEITHEDLRSYFSKFGEVIDVYIPKPFRAFAFVTFSDPHVAAGLCGEDHIINNASIHISSAEPKEARGRGERDGGDRGRGRDNTPPASNSHQSSGPGNQMSGPGGGSNMNGPMGGFNMGNFPMNPAMFAALASQGGFGMFGMPGQNMMGGNPMNGYQGPPGNNYNYNSSGGYNQGGYPGYNQNTGTGPAQPSSQNSFSGSGSSNMWGGAPNTGGSGDNKDLKGTAGWSSTTAGSKAEPMASSWNQL